MRFLQNNGLRGNPRVALQPRENSLAPRPSRTPRLVISSNAAWNVVNFRLGLLDALRADGFDVVAVAPDDAYAARLADHGIGYVPLAMDKQGLSPLRDGLLLLRYWSVLRRLRPDVYLGYTAKPNVYGSLAAHLLGIKVVNNVAGLGTAFIRGGLLSRIVQLLYRLAFSRSATVFFQNDEDRAMFVARGIVAADKAALLPGSGLDLSRYPAPQPRAASGEGFTFLLIARLIWDKGVREFVEAARIVKAARPGARLQLLGFLDVENRTAVPRAEVEAWVAEGLVEYLGDTEDVRPFIAAADCIVLPSYREGMPRVLLEGAAMAKPLIATDVPGCRGIVTAGENGLLCEVRSGASLAEAMLRMIDLSEDERARMGAAGRRRIETEFDEKIVVDRYRAAIAKALGR